MLLNHRGVRARHHKHQRSQYFLFLAIRAISHTPLPEGGINHLNIFYPRDPGFKLIFKLFCTFNYSQEWMGLWRKVSLEKRYKNHFFSNSRWVPVISSYIAFSPHPPSSLSLALMYSLSLRINIQNHLWFHFSFSFNIEGVNFWRSYIFYVPLVFSFLKISTASNWSAFFLNLSLPIISVHDI